MAKKTSSLPFFGTMTSQTSVTGHKELTCFCDVGSVENNVYEKSDDASKKDENEKEIKSLWQTILDESKDFPILYEERIKCNDEDVFDTNPDSPADYLYREIFPTLLIGMEKMLNEARSLDVLRIQKCRFNGLDYLAEYLWNTNPKWPSREKWLDVYDIPQFKLCLKLHPRPIFPKSWLWSTDEAASRIQRCVRGWLVRKRDDVQELRQFWKMIKDEENIGSVDASQGPKELDICERYKLLAKKRARPF